jgi:hypothetical protein
MNVFGNLLDRLFGRGEWAVTVPSLDGPLVPNQKLEEAERFASLPEVDNLVATERGIIASSGAKLVRYDMTGAAETLADFDHPVSALAHAREMLAVGLDGRGLVIRGGIHEGREVRGNGNQAFGCITALTFLDPDVLLLANGSQKVGAGEWRRDLIEKGDSGSVWKVDLRTGQTERLAEGLAWPAGIGADGSNRIYVTESWRHRVLSIDLKSRCITTALEHLPAYPARIAPASNCGYWLGFYSVRNQLVEFILREEGYRRRMLAEVPEPFWMAPSLASYLSHQEPMQGSQLKRLGVLKPYAVTRSYGLVVNCDSHMKPLSSYHSRADGAAHGTVATCEYGQDLFVASRGGGKILRLTDAAGK